MAAHLWGIGPGSRISSQRSRIGRNFGPSVTNVTTKVPNVAEKRPNVDAAQDGERIMTEADV